MSYQDVQTCRVEDKSGEMLRCEFSVYESPANVFVPARPEVRLRSVTFNDGQGSEVLGGADHARFLGIMRQDFTFADHHDWPTLQGKCEEARMLGQSRPAVEVQLSSEAFA